MPADAAEQDLKAQMWAAAIYDTITYAQAQQIIVSHYQTSNETIGVADINGVTTTKTPMYLVPQSERTELVASPEPPPLEQDTPTDPCDECGRYYIHDTRLHPNGNRYCSKAPGRVP